VRGAVESATRSVESIPLLRTALGAPLREVTNALTDLSAATDARGRAPESVILTTDDDGEYVAGDDVTAGNGELVDVKINDPEHYERAYTRTSDDQPVRLAPGFVGTKDRPDFAVKGPKASGGRIVENGNWYSDYGDEYRLLPGYEWLGGNRGSTLPPMMYNLTTGDAKMVVNRRPEQYPTYEQWVDSSGVLWQAAPGTYFRDSSENPTVFDTTQKTAIPLSFLPAWDPRHPRQMRAWLPTSGGRYWKPVPEYTDDELQRQFEVARRLADPEGGAYVSRTGGTMVPRAPQVPVPPQAPTPPGGSTTSPPTVEPTPGALQPPQTLPPRVPPTAGGGQDGTSSGETKGPGTLPPIAGSAGPGGVDVYGDDGQAPIGTGMTPEEAINLTWTEARSQALRNLGMRAEDAVGDRVAELIGPQIERAVRQAADQLGIKVTSDDWVYRRPMLVRQAPRSSGTPPWVPGSDEDKKFYETVSGLEGPAGRRVRAELLALRTGLFDNELRALALRIVSAMGNGLAVRLDPLAHAALARFGLEAVGTARGDKKLRELVLRAAAANRDTDAGHIGQFDQTAKNFEGLTGLRGGSMVVPVSANAVADATNMTPDPPTGKNLRVRVGGKGVAVIGTAVTLSPSDGIAEAFRLAGEGRRAWVDEQGVGPNYQDGRTRAMLNTVFKMMLTEDVVELARQAGAGKVSTRTEADFPGLWRLTRVYFGAATDPLGRAAVCARTQRVMTPCEGCGWDTVGTGFFATMEEAGYNPLAAGSQLRNTVGFSGDAGSYAYQLYKTTAKGHSGARDALALLIMCLETNQTAPAGCWFARDLRGWVPRSVPGMEQPVLHSSFAGMTAFPGSYARTAAPLQPIVSAMVVTASSLMHLMMSDAATTYPGLGALKWNEALKDGTIAIVPVPTGKMSSGTAVGFAALARLPQPLGVRVWYSPDNGFDAGNNGVGTGQWTSGLSHLVLRGEGVVTRLVGAQTQAYVSILIVVQDIYRTPNAGLSVGFFTQVLPCQPEYPDVAIAAPIDVTAVTTLAIEGGWQADDIAAASNLYLGQITTEDMTAAYFAAACEINAGQAYQWKGPSAYAIDRGLNTFGPRPQNVTTPQPLTNSRFAGSCRETDVQLALPDGGAADRATKYGSTLQAADLFAGMTNGAVTCAGLETENVWFDNSDRPTSIPATEPSITFIGTHNRYEWGQRPSYFSLPTMGPLVRVLMTCGLCVYPDQTPSELPMNPPKMVTTLALLAKKLHAQTEMAAREEGVSLAAFSMLRWAAQGREAFANALPFGGQRDMQVQQERMQQSVMEKLMTACGINPKVFKINGLLYQPVPLAVNPGATFPLCHFAYGVGPGQPELDSCLWSSSRTLCHVSPMLSDSLLNRLNAGAGWLRAITELEVAPTFRGWSGRTQIAVLGGMTNGAADQVGQMVERGELMTLFEYAANLLLSPIVQETRSPAWTDANGVVMAQEGFVRSTFPAPQGFTWRTPAAVVPIPGGVVPVAGEAQRQLASALWGRACERVTRSLYAGSPHMWLPFEPALNSLANGAGLDFRLLIRFWEAYVIVDGAAENILFPWKALGSSRVDEYLPGATYSGVTAFYPKKTIVVERGPK
jgi:hypothetical protein